MKKQTLYRITIVLASLLSLSLSSAFAKQKVTVYGDSNYPPYSYEENKEVKGIYVDILKKAFSKMAEYDVEIKTLPWKRGIHYVKSGKAVALFPPYFSEERTLWMNFSEPILQEQVIVFGKASKLEGKIKWPEDFYNSKIGMNSGFNPTTMAGEKFAKAIEAGRIEFDDSAVNNEMNLKKLQADRLDFYVTDKMIDISQFPSIKRGIVVKNNDGYLGFTRKYENFSFLPDFKKKFDAVIKEMKASGEISSILKKYM